MAIQTLAETACLPFPFASCQKVGGLLLQIAFGYLLAIGIFLILILHSASTVITLAARLLKGYKQVSATFLKGFGNRCFLSFYYALIISSTIVTIFKTFKFSQLPILLCSEEVVLTAWRKTLCSSDVISLIKSFQKIIK